MSRPATAALFLVPLLWFALPLAAQEPPRPGPSDPATSSQEPDARGSATGPQEEAAPDGEADAPPDQDPSSSTAMGDQEPKDGFSEVLRDAMPESGAESVDVALRTFAEALGGLIDSLTEQLPNILIGLFILLATAFAAKIGRGVARRTTRKLKLRASLRDLAGHLTLVMIWFLGLLVALGVIFPGFGITEIAATAGLVSIAIGFAFQDIFENFFAGVLILWRFPFEVNDFIEIESEGITGKVENIWIRMTLIRLTTGELVTVPNATVYKSPIRILTNSDRRRITVECGVAYGEDVGEARRVIRKAVESCETVLSDSPIQIFLQGFGASSMDFEVTWWTRPRPVDQRKSRDEVVEAVKRALDAAGVEIPYPYRVLTFTRNEPLIYEQMAGRTDRADDAES